MTATNMIEIMMIVSATMVYSNSDST
jgi:hypothetical protein